MKVSSPFFNFVKQLNPNEEEKQKKLKSMKEFFHNPFAHIKSENLLNNYSSPKKLDSSNNEYSFILNNKKKELENIPNITYEQKYNFIAQNKLSKIKGIPIKKNLKNQDSSESSFNNYNYKVGLNAPLSYNEISYNSSGVEKNEKSKVNLKKNQEKIINSNLLNEIARIKKKSKIDYNVFINVESPKKLNFDNNNNIKANNSSMKPKSNYNIQNGIFLKKNNNNYSQIYSNRTKYNNEKTNINRQEKNNIIFENQKNHKIRKNNNNIKIKILNKDIPNKTENLGIFEQILMDLKSVKSAININNKHIVYNISNTNNCINDKKLKKNNKSSNSHFINNQNIIQKTDDSENSSNSISLDLNDINSSRMNTNDIKIKTTYNLTKKCTDKKNKLLKNNYKKINISLRQKKNGDSSEKNIKIQNAINKNKNFEYIYSESVSDKSPSTSKNKIYQNVTGNNEEDSEDNKEIINFENGFIKKSNQNINNKKYLEKVFESRKILAKDMEGMEPNSEIPGVKLYNRSQIYYANSKRKTEKLRKKLKEKENSEILSSPIINNKSKKITKNHSPIYLRIEDIKKKKQTDIRKIKDLIVKENEINENTINQKCEKNFNKNNFDKWILSNNNWNKQKNSKIKKMKDMLNQQKLDDENLKSKPTINPESIKIFNKNEELSKSPVVERLFKSNNKKALLMQKEDIKKNLSFIPEINKKYEISDKYYSFMEEDQAELYNELKEKVQKKEKKKDKFFDLNKP